MTRVWVVSTWTDALTSGELISRVIGWSKEKKSKAIFFCTAHMIIEAYDSKHFAAAMSQADLICADGRPIFLIQKLFSNQACSQNIGISTMRGLIEKCSSMGIPIGFYGSTPEVLSALKQKLLRQYPNLQINYNNSPPFRELSVDEAKLHAKEINASGAQMLFVGLGCPKQELWIANQANKIKMPMLAVGAAFDFMAESKRVAPQWLRVLSLEWLFRLVNEPRRLWKRYLILNPRFIFYILMQFVFRKFQPPRN